MDSLRPNIIASLPLGHTSNRMAGFAMVRAGAPLKINSSSPASTSSGTEARHPALFLSLIQTPPASGCTPLFRPDREPPAPALPFRVAYRISWRCPDPYQIGRAHVWNAV